MFMIEQVEIALKPKSRGFHLVEQKAGSNNHRRVTYGLQENTIIM